ncbi:PREDICTED: pyruvate kinase PKM-like isoform X2 [Nicrophorus vespilloides]|nr:PREDICTED: pyruvate kinase PKM-like isoform X2 [Nicrophorus vespilloides]
MIDFFSTEDGRVPNAQLKAAFASDQLSYQSKLDFESKPARKRLTSIVCSIGPSSSSVDVLEDLITAGMSIARIKTPFFTQIEAIQMVANIRLAADNVSRKLGSMYPVAIGFDLRGPEIRTGVLKHPSDGSVQLHQGNETVITCDPSYEEHVTEDMIYVDYQKLHEVVEPGDRFYLDNHVTLSALEIVGSFIRCIIETAGRIGDRVSVSMDNSILDLPSISEVEVERAKELDVDIIFVSSVKSKEVIEEVRKYLGDDGKHVVVVAKIENELGVKNIESIAKEADGILLSRNNLANEIAVEKTFLVQKMIAAVCNKLGKPMICAPQMLDSMVSALHPKRCEVTDIANAILDGVDCLMLSRETACGDNPVECVHTLSGICKEAEAAVFHRKLFEALTQEVPIFMEPIYSLSIGVVEASVKSSAAAIIVLTTSGRTAKIIAKYRPRCPIIAVTRHSRVSRQLRMYRAVEPIHFIKKPLSDWTQDVRRRLQFAITFGKYLGFIRAADTIVILTGNRPGTGFTNTMSVYYASHFDAIDEEIEKQFLM